MDTDLSKIRRFSLTLGAIILLYAMAGARSEDINTIQFLGITIRIANPHAFKSVLESALLMIAFYSAWRYWHYGYVLATSPHKMRKIILGRNIILPITNDIEVHRLMNQYFPGYAGYSHQIEENGRQGKITVYADQVGWRTKILYTLSDVDYMAPILLNGIAIILFIALRSF